jgi:hypothetical protein
MEITDDEGRDADEQEGEGDEGEDSGEEEKPKEVPNNKNHHQVQDNWRLPPAFRSSVAMVRKSL